MDNFLETWHYSKFFVGIICGGLTLFVLLCSLTPSWGSNKDERQDTDFSLKARELLPLEGKGAWSQHPAFIHSNTGTNN